MGYSLGTWETWFKSIPSLAAFLSSTSPQMGFLRPAPPPPALAFPHATQEPLCTPGRGLGTGIEKIKGGYICPGGSQAGTWQQPSLPSTGHTVQQMTLWPFPQSGVSQDRGCNHLSCPILMGWKGSRPMGGGDIWFYLSPWLDRLMRPGICQLLGHTHKPICRVESGCLWGSVHAPGVSLAWRSVTLKANKKHHDRLRASPWKKGRILYFWTKVSPHIFISQPSTVNNVASCDTDIKWLDFSEYKVYQ